MCTSKYAEKGDLSKLVEYKITPQDFDVINHLAVGSGLKSRDVTKIKKALNNEYFVSLHLADRCYLRSIA
jgi:hypothetical protein